MKDWLAWWNAIYWVPLGLSLLWITLSAIGTEMEVDSSDAPDGSDASGEDVESAGSADWAGQLRDVFGLSHVSIMMLLGIAMLCWGTIGLIINNASAGAGIPPERFVLPSLAGTVVASFLLTRGLVELIGRFAPSTETFAITASDLIGREGTVVFAITDQTGTVNVADVYGTVHRRMARGEVGAPRLAANSPVLIVGYDEAADRVIVREQLSSGLVGVSPALGKAGGRR